MCGHLWWVGKAKYVPQVKQVATPCIDDYQLKREDFEVVGELGSVCAQSFFEHVCVSTELVNLTFCGQLTNSQEQLKVEQRQRSKTGKIDELQSWHRWL